MNSADSPDCNPIRSHKKKTPSSNSSITPDPLSRLKPTKIRRIRTKMGRRPAVPTPAALRRRFCSPISHRLVKKMLECVKQLQKKNKLRKHSNTVTIDSIYKKNFLSLNSVLEAVIVDIFVLPGNLVTEEL
ncbi:uncharacterized protein LOC133734062 [Rosa rugosa]|uniref:uncharacterized protein LOC133734062 n=1 Tax=Rosa rugosa TaxID=74645 RepID=UPI002B411141|nr:uncharacterized protein LOC133734062 [Rosa rugosa]